MYKRQSLFRLADTAGVIRFHGGAEAEVRKRPALAWDVDHHDPTKRAANAKVFDAVAAVLRAAPGVALEVHVETSKTDAAPRAIAEHLRLDPRRDVQHVMEQLAKLRAQACVDALVARGVPARRLSASGTGRGGAVNPTFIASAAGAAAGAARASSCLLYTSPSPRD